MQSKVYVVFVMDIRNWSRFILSNIYGLSSFSNNRLSRSRNIGILNNNRIHNTDLSSFIVTSSVRSSQIEVKEPINVGRINKLIFGIIKVFIGKEQMGRCKGLINVKNGICRISNASFIGSLKLLSDGQNQIRLSGYISSLISCSLKCHILPIYYSYISFIYLKKLIRSISHTCVYKLHSPNHIYSPLIPASGICLI